MLRLMMLILCLAVAAPSVADAGRVERKLMREAKKHKKEGLRHLKQRRHDRAVQDLQIAYGLSQETILLFHIGEAYNGKGEHAEALYYYRSFRDADPKAAAARKVDVVIDALAALIEPAGVSGADPPPEPEPEPVALAPPADSTPAVIAEPAPARVLAPPAITPARGRGKRTVGVVIVGVGVVAAAAGGYFANVARVRSDEVSELFARGATWDHDGTRLYDEGRIAERRSMVLVGAGSAAIVTGAVLFYLGVRDRASGLEVVPAASTSAGAVVRLSFDF